MNTLHLKYALEIEKTRSITQAAENLFMAQPNLSKTIKEFEETLGFVVFERGPKGVLPTQKGAEFLVYAKNILSQIDKIESLSKTLQKEVQQFNISIPRGSYIAAGVINFVEQLDFHKGINVNVQETNSLQAITNIVEHRFNLGVIRYDITFENYFRDYLKDKDMMFESIWEFENLVIFSKNHPLAQKENLHITDFKDYVELVHGDTTIPYLHYQKKPDYKQIEKRIYVYERASQFEILEMIQDSYMLVSPIPKKMLNRFNLVQKNYIGMTHRYKDVLIYHRDYKLTELDRKFVEQLYTAKNEVLSQQI